MTTRTLVDGQPLLPSELTEDELIGEKTHMHLFRRRRSQTWLAKQMGMTPAAVSRKLRGQRPWLASEVVVVARLLGVSPLELLPDSGEATAPTPPDGGPTSAQTSEATMRRNTACDELTIRRIRRSPDHHVPAHAPVARVAS